ncbi:MAG: MmgE/PrpD family protein [Alphaproteobacteria bacterium]
MASMSRTLAAWVAGLTYDDLSADVVDRARGVTLQALTSALVGEQFPDSRDALAMMREEEEGGGGACTTLGSGVKLTRAGAALVNAETIFAGGKWDTFRMLTHPGCAIIPAALVAAEIADATGKDFITGVAAGYEVMERMAADFIPTIMSRGFHSGPVFGIFGAAVALAKITGLNADQTHAAIAQCVNLASGNLEGARSGGKALREGGAVRNAMLAVAMARHGAAGGETALEGKAGFYHAYIGNNRGDLRYSFTADNRADMDRITANLGKDWMFLETLYRIYSTAGYNIAHVDVTAALCAEHGIKYDDVERIHTVVNWLETEYPSPAFPSRSGLPAIDNPHYYAAYAVVTGGFPLDKFVQRKTGEADPAAVLELMQRVTITPSHRHPLFAPSVTIHLKDGRSVTKDGTGREFIFDFEGLVARIGGIAPSLPIPATQYEALTQACRTLETLDRADSLIPLTLISK